MLLEVGCHVGPRSKINLHHCLRMIYFSKMFYDWSNVFLFHPRSRFPAFEQPRRSSAISAKGSLVSASLPRSRPSKMSAEKTKQSSSRKKLFTNSAASAVSLQAIFGNAL